MKDEFEKIGIKLAKLAKKYGEEHIDLVYIDGCIQGFNSPAKEKHIDIFMDKEEVEKRCLKENI